MYRNYNQTYVSIWKQAGEEAFWQGKTLDDCPGLVEARRYYWQMGWLETFQLYMEPMLDDQNIHENMEIAYDNAEQFL